ncbi:hypothetical protein CC78DRAFT_620702 [Lojkania enalia]|uniref:Uncharacterized protein n=1 Tax=Lojkania enalia TaxID=147567 RepID=A0A9P4K4A4_9PLEO|nr:hypothetical protein CC78DRAFT_620702 [Didymosphaeria enalia]
MEESGLGAVSGWVLDSDEHLWGGGGRGFLKAAVRRSDGRRLGQMAHGERADNWRGRALRGMQREKERQPWAGRRSWAGWRPSPVSPDRWLWQHWEGSSSKQHAARWMAATAAWKDEARVPQGAHHRRGRWAEERASERGLAKGEAARCGSMGGMGSGIGGGAVAEVWAWQAGRQAGRPVGLGWARQGDAPTHRARKAHTSARGGMAAV